jgi:hypothetical protein
MLCECLETGRDGDLVQARARRNRWMSDGKLPYLVILLFSLPITGKPITITKESLIKLCALIKPKE